MPGGGGEGGLYGEVQCVIGNGQISKRCGLIVYQFGNVINICHDPAISGKNNNRLRSLSHCNLTYCIIHTIRFYEK